MKRILNFKFLILNFEKGQALITLLFFTVIGITVISATVVILFVNTLSATTSEQGTSAYYLAESGAEDGYLHLLRDPNYAGTYLPFGAGNNQISVTIAKTGTTGSITSTGTLNNTVRKIQAKTVYNSDGTISISSWKEIN